VDPQRFKTGRLGIVIPYIILVKLRLFSEFNPT
jgi:hypothetical protein